MPRKVYVGVLARYEADGRFAPLEITWEDGRVYDIDRILSVVPAASLKVGGFGTRFTCRIQGKESHLFWDEYENRWFMEGR